MTVPPLTRSSLSHSSSMPFRPFPFCSRPLAATTDMLAILSIIYILATLPVARSQSVWTAQLPINPGFPYGSQHVRGVNLGGWLVIEVCCRSIPIQSLPLLTSPISVTAYVQPWITPSLFEETGNSLVVDEWTYGQYQDPNVARAKLVQHWETWITEDDFGAIAGAGWVLSASKIPNGF